MSIRQLRILAYNYKLMSNIHGLNDSLNTGNNRGGYGQQGPPPNIDPESQQAMDMFKSFRNIG
jgi:hypothetical protein